MKTRPVLFVVSTTHWDPEWYCTWQEYRIRLVQLIDRLLPILERQPEYRSFMFDGQISAIGDYLEIHPEREARIRSLVKSGKLVIGPWWILPEEFMVSGEALIRNLLMGYAEGRRLGGIMPVSYLCDMPGHIAQLPQILKGFNINAACGWRGIMGYPRTGRTEFTWRGTDGSEILMLHLVHGYGNAAKLAVAKDLVEAVRKICAKLRPYAATRNLLLLDGKDHREAYPQITRVIRDLKRKYAGEFDIRHATLPDYVNAVRRARPRLAIHSGELRASQTAQIFSSGILATRMDLKIATRQSELQLEQWAEPFNVLAWRLGHAYPRGLLQCAWRHLLRNNFHDVMYGGHIDAVTPDAMTRHKAAQEIAHWLTQQALHNVVRRIDTRSAELALVVFNPHPHPVTGVVRAELWDEQFLKRGPGPQQISLVDERGQAAPAQVIRAGCSVHLTTDMGVAESEKAITSMKYELFLLASDVPALGFKTYAVQFAAAGSAVRLAQITDLRFGPRSCENRHLAVRINSNGTLDIKDKRTGHVYAELNYLEDAGDVGDHYFYAAPAGNRRVTTRRAKARIRLIHGGPVEAEYAIIIPFKIPRDSSPDGRSRRTVMCPIRMSVRLQAEGRRVEVTTHIDNRAVNHRLRAVFPAGIASAFCDAEGTFEVVRRSAQPAPHPQWLENPEGYYPQRRFVSVHQGRRGFALINRGLPQFQIDPAGNIRLTLLRSVSHLCKYAMPGWGVNAFGEKDRSTNTWPTPAAQELGGHRFDYALYPHAGDWLEERCHVEAMRFNAPLKAMQTSAHTGSLPWQAGFLSIQPETLALSAVKQAEQGKALIVRLWNVSGRSVRGTISLHFPYRKVTPVNLQEAVLPARTIRQLNKQTIAIRIAPHKIVSLKYCF